LNFDAAEPVTLHIEGQGGPNSGTGTFDAAVVADSNGEFVTGVISLSEGLYKLDADGAESPGAGKHKVFTVECPPTTPTTTTTTTTTRPVILPPTRFTG